MAITAVGFTDSLANEVQWAKMWAIGVPGGQIVDNGWTPAAATGTRLISVTAGDLIAAGVYANNSATANAPALAANTSGQSRYDIVVALINWSADTVTLSSVQGTPGTPPQDPTLTQTPGTTWHVPLARVLVRNNVTQIAAADVFDIRPTRPHPMVYNPAVTLTTMNAGASPKTIVSRDIPDPGWPYRIRVSGVVEFSASSAGRALVSANIDGAALIASRAAQGNAAPAIIPATLSDNLTGPHTVTLTMQPFNMSEQLSSQSGSSFQIEVVRN